METQQSQRIAGFLLFGLKQPHQQIQLLSSIGSNQPATNWRVRSATDDQCQWRRSSLPKKRVIADAQSSSLQFRRLARLLVPCGPNEAPCGVPREYPDEGDGARIRSYRQYEIALLVRSADIQSSRKRLTSSATVRPSVSSAKCPVSRRTIRAAGMSRRNASAPSGAKNGSFLPQAASSRG